MADAVEADTADVLNLPVTTKRIDIVFSDLDGTLIHYPADIDGFLSNKNVTDIILLPPSSTGMVGVMSTATIHLIRDIRRTGVKFVLVSGMRASTLLKRMPFLPKADAYCCEAGGRIFYPTKASFGACTVQPSAFSGCVATDLDPFSLVEDLAWRKRIEQIDAAGTDGFVGNELPPSPICGDIPISRRESRLWAFAQLLAEKGFVVDAKGYSTCFRLNRTQQASSAEFERLLDFVSTNLPSGLSTSTNLGCVDVYPRFSGKKNWYVVAYVMCSLLATLLIADVFLCLSCLYLAKIFGFSDTSVPGRCICLCDDDNDLEMALECLHAYIPHVTSHSMAEAVRLHPGKFTVTSNGDGINTDATEKALHYVLEKVRGGEDRFYGEL
jgi:hypothetical protein